MSVSVCVCVSVYAGQKQRHGDKHLRNYRFSFYGEDKKVLSFHGRHGLPPLPGLLWKKLEGCGRGFLLLNPVP